MYCSTKIVVVLIAFAALSGPVLAESSGEQTEVDSGGCHCFVGRPYPRCCDFWLVEIGPGIAVASSANWLESGTTMLAADFGFMWNLDSRSGVGITLFGATDSYRSRAGLHLRYRRWLSPKTALDLSPGLLVVGGDTGPYTLGISYPCFMATAAVTYASRVSAFAGVEFLRVDVWGEVNGYPVVTVKRTETILWTGVSCGAELGVAGMAAVLGLLVLMAATW